MFQQDLQPVGRLAVPQRNVRRHSTHHPVRAARWPAHQGLAGRTDLARRGPARRRPALRDARRPGAARRHRGCGVRVLPDPVDRHQRDLGLQPDGDLGALRRVAPFVREGQSGPADPGDHHRVLLRGAARGAGGLRHPGGDHRGDADGTRLPAGQGRGRLADRQHRPGRVRRARHPDRHAGRGLLRREQRPRAHRGHARRDGGTPDPDPRGVRPARAGPGGGRQARRAADLAPRPGLRDQLRARPVRRGQLHLRAARGHRRGARLGGCGRRAPARLDPGRGGRRGARRGEGRFPGAGLLRRRRWLGCGVGRPGPRRTTVAPT